jgi:hypothetical protein
MENMMVNNREQAITEFDLATKAFNLGLNLDALEHAEKAMRLDPNITGLYDIMARANMNLYQLSKGSPEARNYERRFLHWFKRAARLGSKSAQKQLDYINIKWHYPQCHTCGGFCDPDDDVEVIVQCTCGSKILVWQSTISREAGADIVHSNIVFSEKSGAQWKRCQYTTHIPSSVWCRDCQHNLVSGWENILPQPLITKTKQSLLSLPGNSNNKKWWQFWR